ncbi:glycosyltransferase [Haloarcula marina]|uniref:glycosyltransferase n=1 Tax=Haloarcula marina TaxID=2961574 RepID=UPI0020B6661A|nr:glycosyltransferase [Halomicroarcula marina]
MRPCLLLNDFNGGGAERLVKDLAVELDQRNDVDPVVVASNRRGELEEAFEESGVELSVLGVDVAIASVGNGTARLLSRLRELDVDVVHSHLAFSDLVGRLACLGLSLPHVSTYHNVEEKRPPLKRAVEHATRPLSEQIVCVSDGVRQSYGNDPRMRVIYNAIDVEAFNGRVAAADPANVPKRVQSAETVFLNVARCVDVKRQWDLISAMERLDAPDAHLVVVGDGPLRSDLEAIVSEKGLSESVTITGFVDSIEPYYACADAFVSSSSKEGLPTTHIEAMAAELPVISTDIPGVREIVEHDTTGYLCPVGEPETLAGTMQRIHGKDCRHLADRGYQTAMSTFSMERVAAEHASLYWEVAGDS